MVFCCMRIKVRIELIFKNMRGKKIKVYPLVLPVWVRVCVLRWSDRENVLWHVSHWKGFTPTQKWEWQRRMRSKVEIFDLMKQSLQRLKALQKERFYSFNTFSCVLFITSLASTWLNKKINKKNGRNSHRNISTITSNLLFYVVIHKKKND